MYRRAFLASSALVLPLTACQHNSNNPATNVSQAATDVTLIARGLGDVLSQLAQFNIPGLTPELIAAAAVGINGITAVAAQIATVTSNAEAQPLVQKVGTYLNAVVNALTTVPLPPEIAMGLRAASILLPIIEAAVGLIINRVSTPRATKLMAGAPMSVEQARSYLASRPAT